MEMHLIKPWSLVCGFCWAFYLVSCVLAFWFWWGAVGMMIGIGMIAVDGCLRSGRHFRKIKAEWAAEEREEKGNAEEAGL